MICLNGEVLSLIHIRLKLEDYRFRRSFRKLLKRNGRLFRIEHGPAVVTPEKDNLYQAQKHKFKGFIHPNLEEFLFDDPTQQLFNTREIAVYDGDKLVAISFFDEGKASLASLLGLYDPAYRRFSPGIYTMLLEIQHGLNTQKRFYYPGYVLHGHDEFDYKLRLGELQFYSRKGRWYPIDRLEEEEMLASYLKEKMVQLERVLSQAQVPHRTYMYPFYSVGYTNFIGQQLMRSIMFVACYPADFEDPYLVVEYNLERETYLVSTVFADPDYQEFVDATFADEYQDNQRYILDLLSYEDILLETPSLSRVVERIRSLGPVRW